MPITKTMDKKDVFRLGKYDNITADKRGKIMIRDLPNAGILADAISQEIMDDINSGNNVSEITDFKLKVQKVEDALEATEEAEAQGQAGQGLSE